MIRIKKSAIKAFLNAKRADFRYYKKLTEDELEARKDSLPIQPPIWRKLRQHQKACLLLGIKRRYFGWYLSTGMGKSLLALAAIKYFRKLKEANCVLVLVPNRSNKTEWSFEIDKHSPKTPYCILEGSTQHKWGQFDENEDALIFVETYAGLSRMVCTLQKNKKGKNKLKPDPKLLKKLLARVDGLIMDESTHVANRAALPYRICRQLSKDASFVYALTGTPFGRSPELLWAQLHLIDQGETLGQTLGLFRAAFFNSKDNGFGGEDHTFNKSMSGTLNRFLAHSTINFKPDASDLPSVVRITKEVRLPNEARTYYTKAREALYKAGKDPQKIQELFIRIRQISSGFIGYKDEDSKGQFFFDPNPKLEMLLSLVESIDRKEKIIIFNEFIPSGNMICKALKDMGLAHVRLDGRTKDSEAVLRAFREGKEANILVLATQAGSFGLNLQAARYGLVYESPVGVILRKQMEARFIRQYSEHGSVFLYDLTCRGTVDQAILAFHKEGDDLMKAIIQGKAQI